VYTVKNHSQKVSKFALLFFRDSQAGAFLSRGVLSTAKPKHKVFKTIGKNWIKAKIIQEEHRSGRILWVGWFM
jgi:hypothetical protein